MGTEYPPRKTPARWMVFRCPGSETGDLEDLLEKLGFSVWTPRVWVSRRVPRRKVRRVILLAMLPSYLFVDAEADRKELEKLGAKHGFWGPMAIRGERVVIKDEDLDGLRESDDRIGPPRRWVDPLSQRDTLPPARPRLVVAPATPFPTLIPSTQSPESNAQSQDEIAKGDLVDVISGPLASTGLVGLLVDDLKDGKVCVSIFGGRTWMPLEHLRRRC